MLELYLLITIGQSLGAAATVAIVLVTGMLGAALARREGSRVLQAWQEATARGEMPKDGLVASGLVLVGGILLITPGVLTDVTGLLLLVPVTRRFIAKFVRGWLLRRFKVQSFTATPGGLVDLGGFGPGLPCEPIDADVNDSQVLEPLPADAAPPQ